MSNASLSNIRSFNRAFKGRDDVVLIEAFPIRDGERIKLVIESKNSVWRQGVWLKTDRYLVVNHQQALSIDLWQDTAPREVMIECHTQNGCLNLYNIWDKGNGRNSQSWSSGMVVEELSNGRRYHCNDIGFETNFDKLIFRIEHV